MTTEEARAAVKAAQDAAVTAQQRWQAASDAMDAPGTGGITPELEAEYSAAMRAVAEAEDSADDAWDTLLAVTAAGLR